MEKNTKAMGRDWEHEWKEKENRKKENEKSSCSLFIYWTAQKKAQLVHKMLFYHSKPEFMLYLRVAVYNEQMLAESR